MKIARYDTPRVRRRLFNLAAAVSLVLWAATVVLWVRSYWMGAGAQWLTPVADFSFKQGRGRIYLRVLQHDPRAAGPRFGAWKQDLMWSNFLDAPADGDIVHLRLLGFSYRRWVKGTGTFYPNWRLPGRGVTLPHWFAASVFAVPVVLAARRRQARTPGRCASCGYDLRVTPDRCPECGAVPDARPAAPETSA